MRRSSVFFIQTAIGFIILCLILIHSHISIKDRENEIRLKKEMVKVLGITDLCLFTEARYTRHPSMADLNTPFQDYPLSLEHFPSGSLVEPPFMGNDKGKQGVIARSIGNEKMQKPSIHGKSMGIKE